MIIELEEAILRLQRGEAVAIPTDTVYGLAVDPSKQEAVASLYQLKGRPEDKPLLLLGASYAQLLPLLLWEPPLFVELAAAFWPGALTLLAPARGALVPESIRRGRIDVGVRVPNAKETQELLARSGPLAVPSANPSGERPALTAGEVEAYFGRCFPILGGSTVPSGVPSTLLQNQGGKWCVERLGALDQAALANVLGYTP